MIDRLEIEETRESPKIIFDSKTNQFEISGNSLPEDATSFFNPIFDWVEEYIKTPNKETIITCKLEYFNSSSAKMIYQLFIELEKITETGNTIKIKWFYEPEDKLIEEKGLEYQSVLDIPFEMVEIK